VFVTTFGSDATGDGSAAKPFASVSAAIKAGKPFVYLGPGTYDGAIALPAAGVELDGGWVVSGSSFTRDCDAAARTKTIVTSHATNTPVVLADGGKPSTLRTLTVATKDKAAAAPADTSGESLIGILARGGAQLTLVDVDVKAGDAGDAGVATMPTPVGPTACSGVNDCASGMNGVDGTPGGAAPTFGAFDATGYKPGDGKPGVDGTAGANGTAGVPATAAACVTCAASTQVDCMAASPVVAAMQSGDAGQCGCGGAVAPAGGVGRGGGSSVAVFTVGATTAVKSTGGTVSAGAGGKGSDGAVGAPAAAGSTGAKGADSQCYQDQGATTCVWTGTACTAAGTKIVSLPGATGGKGGDGGKGGKGGPGAGGPSYAIVEVGGAAVAPTGTKLVHGNAGASATGAPPADAQDVGVFLRNSRTRRPMGRRVVSLSPIRLSP
jgi:hypothetical protein